MTLWRIIRWGKNNPASGVNYPQVGAFLDINSGLTDYGRKQ